jgi:hypothetical protein
MDLHSDARIIQVCRVTPGGIGENEILELFNGFLKKDLYPNDIEILVPNTMERKRLHMAISEKLNDLSKNPISNIWCGRSGNRWMIKRREESRTVDIEVLKYSRC